jgi:O-antigen/teichoic acid export membrane protein
MNPDNPPKDANINEKISSKSHTDFVTPSIILFIDSILVSVGGWLYWIILSRIAVASEIGLAITVYSLVMLVTTLAQLGIEYPLLKKSNLVRSPILGTSIAIELIITVAAIPIVFAIITNLYNETLKEYVWISIFLLVMLGIEFVVRFGLLGTSNSKSVLIFDLVGLAIKLPIGFYLVSISYGSLGILIAYLVEGLFITFASLLILKKSVSFRLGNIAFFKDTIKDALINSPPKWSKMVIVTISIVLLAYLNTNASDIGVFYVALMISLVVASFATSMAYMVIPTSTTLQKDLTSASLRISLSLTAPLVVALLVIPRSILSLIGSEYESAETVLFILALAIIPSSITVNMISKLNNTGKSKLLIASGILQTAIFFISFFMLVPNYETIGAATSILLAYLGASILLVLTNYGSFKSIVYSSLSVLAGFLMGYIMGTIIGFEQDLVILVSSIVVSIAVILITKSMTIKETGMLIRSILQKK